MFDDAIHILKKRWREVLLLVVLQAAIMLLNERMLRVFELSEVQNSHLPFWNVFILGFGFIALYILWQMIYLGFLKSASLDGEQSSEPMGLLHSGRPYFFHVLILQIVLGFAVILLSYVILMVFSMLLNTQDIPQWLLQVCSIISTFILIKPMLVITARILVYNQSALEGAFYLRCYTLSAIDGLLEFIYSSLSFLVILTVFMYFIKERSLWYYVYSGAFNVVFSLLMLVPSLTVVLFVQRVYEEAVHQKEMENFV